MTTVALVGGGDLARAFIEDFDYKYDIEIFEHVDYDITSEAQCTSLVKRLVNYDVVVVTAGEYSNDSWSMWMTNTVGPCYITEQLNKQTAGKKIIVVTSHSATWTSWPGIDAGRLAYNSSKSATTTFLLGLAHQGSANQITIVEPAQFQSRMSNQQGMDIHLVVEQINDVITNSWHVVQVILKGQL